MFICPKCKSNNVDVKCWVSMNNFMEDTILSESTDEEDYWCNDCESHIIPINDTSINQR
mgnify:CR=1 FL=1